MVLDTPMWLQWINPQVDVWKCNKLRISQTRNMDLHFKALNFVHCMSFRHTHSACHSTEISVYQARRHWASKCTIRHYGNTQITAHSRWLVIGQRATLGTTDGSDDLISLCFTFTGKQILDNYRHMRHPRRMSHPDTKVTDEVLFYTSCT